MKFFSRFIASFVLMLSLTIVAFAGDIQAPGIISSPPPASESCTGDIQAPGAVVPDQVITETVNLIQSLMSVL